MYVNNKHKKLVEENEILREALKKIKTKCSFWRPKDEILEKVYTMAGEGLRDADEARSKQ